MPIFAAFLGSILAKIYSALVYLVGAKFAIRVAIAMAFASSYISMVVVFNSYLEDWLEQVFSSDYGQFLGLLFPPVAGSVIAGLSAFWTIVLIHHYIRGLTKTALG